MRHVFQVSADFDVSGSRSQCVIMVASARPDNVYRHLDSFAADRGWSVLRHVSVRAMRKAKRQEREGWVELVSSDLP